MSDAIEPGMAIEFTGPQTHPNFPVGSVGRCISIEPDIGEAWCSCSCPTGPGLVIDLDPSVVGCPNHWRPLGGDKSLADIIASNKQPPPKEPVPA